MGARDPLGGCRLPCSRQGVPPLFSALGAPFFLGHNTVNKAGFQAVGHSCFVWARGGLSVATGLPPGRPHD